LDDTCGVVLIEHVRLGHVNFTAKNALVEIWPLSEGAKPKCGVMPGDPCAAVVNLRLANVGTNPPFLESQPIPARANELQLALPRERVAVS
jgi:hypothetical protein